MRDAVEPGPIMRDSYAHIGFRLSAGVISMAAWLVIATMVGNDRGDLLAVLAPFAALGVLACLAGRRGDPVAAYAILLGGIVGATVVAWAAGAVGVEPGADPAMRSSYHAMLVIIAAAIAAVVGSLVVLAGYQIGRLVRRGEPHQGDAL